MKNYLEEFKKPVKKFQAGGEMPAPAPQAPAEAPAQGGEPDIQGMLMQAHETQDPNLALEVVNIIVASMGGGQAAPQGGMPMGRYGMKVPKVSKKAVK